MIKRFRHKGLESLFQTGKPKGLDAHLAKKLTRQLFALNAGPLPEVMNLPGWKLHELKGERKGTWSIWVTGNTRLTWTQSGLDADEVDLEDYH